MRSGPLGVPATTPQSIRTYTGRAVSVVAPFEGDLGGKASKKQSPSP
jgi:hypothetical protein